VDVDLIKAVWKCTVVSARQAKVISHMAWVGIPGCCHAGSLN